MRRYGQSDESRERELRLELARLQRRYAEEAKPLIEELNAIEARKPPAPIVITHLLDETAGGPTDQS